MGLRIISSLDISVDHRALPDLLTLSDIQIWENTSNSSKNNTEDVFSDYSLILSSQPALNFISFTNTFVMPAELLVNSWAQPYRVFTNNSQSQEFISNILNQCEFKSGIGSISLLISASSQNLETQSRNSSSTAPVMLLFYFEKHGYDRYSLCATPLNTNQRVYDRVNDICSKSLGGSLGGGGGDANSNALTTAMIQQMMMNDSTNGEDPKPTQISENKKKDKIDQVLEKRNDPTKSLYRAPSVVLPNTENSKASKDSANKIKLTIQRIILSGLRLRGITKSSSEYKDLYYHTFQSVDFTFRNHIRAKVLPSIDILQDTVDTLLSLYLNDNIPDPKT
ncbi:hypothetical protein DASC09_050780 [Saccharomycopsis crataegensis]|uniref:Sld7 C-terminal domain-containing protein n=1 Tax=Saccharomycopsis crataegensis TaxID=43959 RepID=A0AAV5QUD7_9ASCO|nr:hypothetical protein DASC09_050780 [Saccharomycopsis crataegensis]